MERRLAAIVIADVVGYSKLIGADEEGTLARFQDYRARVFEPFIAEYGGRLIKTMGDGYLIEFSSPVSAVNCAVHIQRELILRETLTELEKRLRFRIGINLGDVVVDGDDIQGDSVNIAARLQGLAEPDGILISETVHQHVGNRLKDVAFAFVGEQQVKNIVDAVPTYRVLLDPEQARDQKILRSLISLKVGVVTAALVLVIGVAALAVWLWTPWQGWAPAVTSTEAALSLPDKPSIAVLPFENMSGDPEQAYFADGMAEDIITDLSKLEALFVIARNTTFQYKDKSFDVKRVGQDLGVRYVLEGSVRRVGTAVRINAQLIDATTGGHLWAERYDGEMNDIFKLQDQITKKIVGSLELVLDPDSKQVLATNETSNPDAYDNFLKGWSHAVKITPDDFAAAIPYLERAIDLDPSYGRAYAALAFVYWQGGSMRLWYEKLGVLWGEARTLAAENAEEAMKKPTALAHRVASLMYLDRYKQKFDLAITEAQKAIALEPNHPESHIAMAHALTMSGKASEAVHFIKTAMRLNPKFPSDYLVEMALAHFCLDEYAESEDLLKRAIALNQEDFVAPYLLTLTYALMGRDDEVKRTVEHLESVAPVAHKTVDYRIFWGFFKTREDHERFVDGQKKAGTYGYFSQ